MYRHPTTRNPNGLDFDFQGHSRSYLTVQLHYSYMWSNSDTLRDICLQNLRGPDLEFSRSLKMKSETDVRLTIYDLLLVLNIIIYGPPCSFTSLHNCL